MTTIGPQKKKNHFNLFITGFLGVLILGALLGIPLYNDIVDLKHNIKNGKKQAAVLEVENAEIKKNLYQLMDPDALEYTARELGFVLEKKPTYLEIAPKDLAQAL